MATKKTVQPVREVSESPKYTEVLGTQDLEARVDKLEQELQDTITKLRRQSLI
jgi:hypothetical protein|tara:strand:+ start:204 stop:362 length:159 start_codon:yes stop_codon:yes gene_type:complete